jgi:hypothetical protein
MVLKQAEYACWIRGIPFPEERGRHKERRGDFSSPFFVVA